MLALGFGFWEAWELRDKVTFNMFTRVISVNAGVISLDIKVDVYSAWKRWALADDNNKIGVVVRAIGGDATIGLLKAGDIYFLLNGWLLAVDLSTTAIVGSLFSDDFDTPLIDFDGNPVFQSFVSNLVAGVSSTPTAIQVAQQVWDIQQTLTTLAGSMGLALSETHGQIQREVHIDTELVAVGNGYQQTPFNNWTFAADFAEANGIKHLVITSDAVIDRQLKNFTISGIGVPVLDLNSQVMDKTIVERCELRGAYLGTMQANEVALVNVSGLNGVFVSVSIAGTITVADNANVLMSRIVAAIAGQSFTINMNGAATPAMVSLHNTSGHIVVDNMQNAGDVLHIMAAQGEVTINASCTAGNIVVTDTVKLNNVAAGTMVTVIVTEALQQSRLAAALSA